MTHDNYSALRVSRDAGIARITLDNPPVNVLGVVLMTELRDLLTALRDDESTRVVVFDSANPEFFIAHVDMTLGEQTDGLQELAGRSPGASEKPWARKGAPGSPQGRKKRGHRRRTGKVPATRVTGFDGPETPDTREEMAQGRCERPVGKRPYQPDVRPTKRAVGAGAGTSMSRKPLREDEKCRACWKGRSPWSPGRAPG